MISGSGIFRMVGVGGEAGMGQQELRDVESDEEFV